MAAVIERFGRSFAGRLWTAVILSAPASLAFGHVYGMIFYPSGTPWPDEVGDVEGVTLLSGIMYFVFLAWAAIYVLIGYEREIQARDLEIAIAKNYAMEAQNRMLRYQINPHFLFNTLNALSALVLDGRNETAERVILALSGFLRHSLEKDLGDKISLLEELEVQRQYLAIERIRFAGRLHVVEAVPDGLLDARVPSLVLQPLIENAVKYAVAPGAHPVTITISARAAAGRLLIQITDDGSATPLAGTPRLGIGLRNVKGRLESAYGAAAGLEAGGRPGGGFAVTLALPLERS